MEYKPTVRGIINTALEIVVTRRAEILKAILIPFALLTIVDYASDHETSIALRLALTLVSLAIYTYFAVIIHRAVLLGPGSIQEWGFPIWSKRETYFFFHLLALTIISIIVLFLLALIPHVGIFLGYLAFSYLFIRLSMVFPACAIDEGVTFKSSWSMTKKHQTTMLYIAIIFPIILLLPVYFMKEITSIVIISSAIDTVATVIGVSFLSIAYSQIKAYEYSS